MECFRFVFSTTVSYKLKDVFLNRHKRYRVIVERILIKNIFGLYKMYYLHTKLNFDLFLLFKWPLLNNNKLCTRYINV